MPDRQFRRLLRVRLSNIGLTVREARTYEKCRERLLKSPPDLALIDIDVDPQDAFQLLAEMQQNDNLCRVPIAFLSSRSDRALKLRALRQGVDDYLVNDNMEELIARVENILKLSHSPAVRFATPTEYSGILGDSHKPDYRQVDEAVHRRTATA